MNKGRGLQYIITFCFVLFSAFFLGCSDNEKAPENTNVKTVKEEDKSLAKVSEKKKIVALTRYNANTYFLYKGTPMGFEYDLLKKYADHLGVELEMRAPQSWDSLFLLLDKGEGDLIAANLTVTKQRQEDVLFAEHHNTTRQVLVQRKPKNYRSLKHHQIENALIKDPLQLLGDTVSVRKNSAYLDRLKNLMAEVGGEIFIDTVDEKTETEELIRQVASGEIKYTLADENIAFIHASGFKNLDINTPVSFRQRIAWAVKKGGDSLRVSIDEWMKKLKSKNNPEYYVIYNKYYKNRKAFYKRKSSALFALKSGRISPYDHLFIANSDSIFEWTLLASQAYQESQFDSSKVSWVGAQGIMQLMPMTAKEMKVDSPFESGQNIRGGAAYLKKLYRLYWSELGLESAKKFTLASYNAGAGHVFDARRLAEKNGEDSNSWKVVKEYLLKLSDKKYYYDPVVRHGYCRGSEPVNYVDEILARKKIYDDFLGQAEEKYKQEYKKP